MYLEAERTCAQTLVAEMVVTREDGSEVPRPARRQRNQPTSGNAESRYLKAQGQEQLNSARPFIPSQSSPSFRLYQLLIPVANSSLRYDLRSSGIKPPAHLAPSYQQSPEPCQCRPRTEIRLVKLLTPSTTRTP